MGAEGKVYLIKSLEEIIDLYTLKLKDLSKGKYNQSRVVLVLLVAQLFFSKICRAKIPHKNLVSAVS